MVQFQTAGHPFLEAGISRVIPARRKLSLKRLIANLINNAKRYGPEPIELSASHVDEYILISCR